METINYQGQEIEASRIHRIDGNDDIERGIRCWADELWRDTNGDYYLARERYVRDSWDEDATITNSTETIRRINLGVAIRWAISLTGYEGLALRLDAGALLRRPAHPPRDGLHVQIVAGDGTVYGQGRVRSSLYVGLCARANDCPGGWGYRLTDMLERGLRVVNEPSRIIELDDRAESLLKQYDKQHGWDLAEQEIEPVDIVNGVLVNWLEAMLRVREGRTDAAAIEEAMRRGVFGIMDNEPGQDSEQRAADPAAVSTQPHEPLTVTLDPDASDLVRRFLEKASYTFEAGDVVSGCVVQLLELAFNAVENERNHELASEGRTFADDEWGIAEENAHDARQRRLGLPEHDPAEDDTARAASDERAARTLGLAPSGDADFDLSDPSQPPANLGRCAAHQPEDVALLAAAKPELVSEEDIVAGQAARERDGRPSPIRDGLLHLAADWRDEGARTGGRIAAVLTRCADALEAAVEGKDGR